ncbi:hypothetical protein ABB37_06182 [Leptomonas pyrrhocoris]|uniref:Uncharacterized protein n=1 Tax=Leptomonas pyrrhocoris TaxID=157538 RepID=A0A0N0VEP9_LEPPY|nr:hypothetical protein ABB37_06182 [Leptomonas pyrrhocoris]KPA78582.1 hypothetical protein ABB37_06182 [Leptomonas pyrrhocoris]|eukprot:XP_015657021.1 hypothetical protein ABB37_06182 [Leptomonas pyrrhocoris]
MSSARSIQLGRASPLHTSGAFYVSRNCGTDAHQRHRSRVDTFSHSRGTAGVAAQPARQLKKSRPLLLRTSLLEQLQDAGGSIGSSDGTSAAQERNTTAESLDTVVASPQHSSAHENAASPYVTSSQLLSAQQRTEVNARNSAARHCRATSDAAPSSVSAVASLQLHAQQRALRDAFTHARQHHNVKLKKDPRVYHAERKAFRQAHQGRLPTVQEVSPTVAVPLAPVSALKTLAHADPSRSLLHRAAEDAVLLHNAVVKNELVKSSAPQLVRCLRCFHVYAARPRTLWGGEVEQSGIEYEKAQAQLAADRQLQRGPWRRKRLASVGRRQQARQDDPTCCPQCGSPRAQWMMEYVHHHSHEKSVMKHDDERGKGEDWG